MTYIVFGNLGRMRSSANTSVSFCKRIWLVGAALVMYVMGSAGAADHKGAKEMAQIVQARQDHFRDLGRVAKSLREQIEQTKPNWSLITADANQIERLAAALPTWFPAGSGKRDGIKTKARAMIWEEPPEFARAAQNLANRAQGLVQAAASRDQRALEPRARALGQACESCHHQFRAHSSWWW